MLTNEIKVNGMLIGHLYIVNRRDIGQDGMCEYSYEYYVLPKGKEKVGKIKKGMTIHKREEGAEKLLYLIFKELASVV